MENEIYHKIRKYEQKLENEPTNNVYKYKLKYYYQMIGGLSDLSDVVTREIINSCIQKSGDDSKIGIAGNQTYQQLIKLINQNPKLLEDKQLLSGDKKSSEDSEIKRITRIIEYINLCTNTYNKSIKK